MLGQVTPMAMPRSLCLRLFQKKKGCEYPPVTPLHYLGPCDSLLFLLKLFISAGAALGPLNSVAGGYFQVGWIGLSHQEH